MGNKRLPMRTCIACRNCKPKSELLRIVRTIDSFELDYSGKMNGRGTYICKNKECFDKLVNSRLLNKTFKQNISQEVYDKLKEMYIER